MLLDARRSLFLLVDPQERLLSALPGARAEALAQRWRLLLKAAELLDIPTIVTRQYPKGLGVLPGTLAQALPAAVVCRDKTTFSCLADPAIAGLFEGERDQVVVAGIETHVCVLQTAFDLLDRGITPFVVADACGSRHRESHDLATTRFAHSGVPLVTAESAVFEWLRDAAHPRFRDLAPFIKALAPGD